MSPSARGRPSICATYPGAERATCCGRSRLALPYSVLLRLELAAFHSLRRTAGHRHCGAGPHLAVDGRYPLACSVELGLSSDAAFRPMRPRPSGRLQGRPFYPWQRHSNIRSAVGATGALIAGRGPRARGMRRIEGNRWRSRGRAAEFTLTDGREPASQPLTAPKSAKRGAVSRSSAAGAIRQRLCAVLS